MTTPTKQKPAPAAKLRGDIEGLRAIAVGTVLLYHIGVPTVSGGYIGVDIFFVISGFLITALLIREGEKTGRISILSFYARRARRLLPAATVVLIFTAIAGWLVMPESSHGDLATDVASATAYVVNWALAFRAVDYLAEDAAVSPLQHYWSLSVEEQYYVIWPLMIMLGLFVARRLGVRAKPLLFGTIGVVAAASLAYSVYFTEANPAKAYFFTTTRVWELAIGSLLAFAVVRLRIGITARAANIMAAAGLALIVYGTFFLDSATPWPSAWALVPTVGAALIIGAGCRTEDTVVGRLLSLRPMTWLGGISYSVYLWHWPLLVLAEVQWPEIGLPAKLGIGALSIILALGSRHLIEDPVRFHPVMARRAGVALATGGAMMATSFAAAAMINSTVPELDLDAPVAGATVLIEDQSAKKWQVTDEPEEFYTTSGEVTPDPAVAIQDIPAYYADDCQV
ncbi:MAG TPA: acyltransferase [Nocardioides sp.]